MTHDREFIIWDGTSTSTKTFVIKEGLQQGTVTSPLLFNIYTSDILNSFNLNNDNNTHSIAYADDLIVYVAGKDIPTIQENLQTLVNKINNHYCTWNLRMNPSKCETILFRRLNNRLKKKTDRIAKDNFHIDTHNPDTRAPVRIPTKNIVKYLGIHIDNLMRGHIHWKVQLEKATRRSLSLSRLIHNTYITPTAKVIIYQILIRPILTYAAPVLWNIGASQAENIRRFERICLRHALFLHRSAESQFHHRIKNSILYNTADIPRIDNFMIRLTRDYFASTKDSDNNLIKAFSHPDPIITHTTAQTGYIQPQAFILHDRAGIIQDQNNTPIIMHWRRHAANKKLPPNLNYMLTNEQNFLYDTSIPMTDRLDNHRLDSDKYFWMDPTSVHYNELRNRITYENTRPHRKRKRRKKYRR